MKVDRRLRTLVFMNGMRIAMSQTSSKLSIKMVSFSSRNLAMIFDTWGPRALSRLVKSLEAALNLNELAPFA